MTVEERLSALEKALVSQAQVEPEGFYMSRHSGEEIDNAVDKINEISAMIMKNQIALNKGSDDDK